MKGLNEDLHLRLSKFRGYYWLFSQDEFLEVELLGQVLLKDFGYIVPSCSLEKIIHFILPSTVYESICFSLLSLSDLFVFENLAGKKYLVFLCFFDC